MTVAALPGNVRLRAFQLGKETTFGTTVNATRRFPWTFTPAYDLHVTFPTADTGTLDRALAPYKLASDINGQAVGPLAFNDAPYLWAALVKGGVTAVGGAAPYTWTYTPAYASQDVFEIFTAEAGDDAESYQLSDGVINQLQLQFPEDLGPVQVTADWYFSAITAGPTGFSRQALNVDFVPTWMYAADTSVYIDSTAGGIEGTKLTNTVHGSTITINNNLDKKRFQNGSNTRFQLAGYGRGERLFTTTFTFAKSTAGLAEVANWLNANPVERFLGIKTVSPSIAGGSTPYSQDIRFAGFWTARTDGTYGTANTTDILTCEGFIDQTLAYPFNVAVVNSLGSL